MLNEKCLNFFSRTLGVASGTHPLKSGRELKALLDAAREDPEVDLVISLKKGDDVVVFSVKKGRLPVAEGTISVPAP